MSKLRPYRPYLNAWLDLGFMSFHTELMHHANERYVFNYVVLSWKFFKWGGKFNLYKPGEDFKRG